MFIITSYSPKAALVALAISALLIAFCPVSLQAQTAIAAGETSKKPVKGLDDPEFVGKWDFEQPGHFDGWKPLQAAGVFEAREGVVYVNAKSQRPCLDLQGPYAAEQISLIEIRIRGVEVERETSSSGNSSMSGANDRVKILPALYKGTRLYFTRSAKEKFDAENSFEFSLPLDGKFHVLTVNPNDHPSWKGQLKKIRFDIGDFPNHYELDYIYFHRTPTSRKKSESLDDKAGARVGAITVEPKK